MESNGSKKAAKAEIIPNDDESKDIGIGGAGDDDEPHLYATISAEQKAKKGWVAKLDQSRLVSVIIMPCPLSYHHIISI